VDRRLRKYLVEIELSLIPILASADARLQGLTSADDPKLRLLVGLPLPRTID